MYIQFASSPWYILLCVAIAAIISGILYYKNKNEYQPKWLYTLVTIRFVLIFLISLLLLSPFVKINKERKQKPLLIVGIDHSISIRSTFSSQYTPKDFQNQINQFVSSLEDKFEVRTLSFGAQVENGFNGQFNQVKSDYGQFFNEIKNQISSKQMGAVVMFSDGNFNSGIDAFSAYSSVELPLYTVNLGDTLVFPDIRITQTQHNEQTLIGNEFPLQINIEGINAENTSQSLKITHNGKIVYSQAIEIESMRYSQTIFTHLKAQEVGLQSYTIELSVLKGEKNIKNNSKTIYVQVVDQAQKILLIAATPHPDITAIKQSLSSYKTNEVESVLASEFKGNIGAYSCVILHQLPAKFAKYPFINEIMTLKIPCLFILGKQSDLLSFNALNAGLQIQPKGGNNAALPYFAANFPYFLINEHWSNIINTLPPIETTFGNYQLLEGAHTLIHQKILNIKSLEPLWLFTNQLGHRISILCGEGIWKWKLHEYQQNQNYTVFNELLEQTSQYLGSSDSKHPLSIKHPNYFTEDQDIILMGEFLNASFQYDNTNELKISIEDSNRKSSNLIFSPLEGKYELNAGSLPSGKYKYTAQLKVKDKTHLAQGNFHVIPLQIENENEQSRPYIMNTLAKENGGENFFLANLDDLKHQLIQEKSLTSVVFEDKSIIEGIYLKWIFFLIVSLLSLEWILRKYLGSI